MIEVRGFVILLAVILFSFWVFLCICYAKPVANFIKNTFLKFIGEDEEQNDFK